MAEMKEREPVAMERIEGVGEEVVGQSGEKERSLEVESVIEKLERDIKGDKKKNDVQDDVSATVVPANDGQPAVTLPVTQDELVQGQKMPVWSSFRWLVEEMIRKIKQFSGRVKYREAKNEGN